MTTQTRPTGKTDIWAVLNHTAILLAFIIGFIAGAAATAHAETDVTFPKRASAKPSFIVDELGQHLFGNTPGKVEVTNLPPTNSQPNYQVYTVVEHGAWGDSDSLIPTAGWSQVFLYAQGFSCADAGEVSWRLDDMEIPNLCGRFGGSFWQCAMTNVQAPEIHLRSFNLCNSTDATIKAYMTR